MRSASFLILFVLTFSAAAWGRTNYEACKIFLKLSPAKQQAVAKKAHTTRGAGIAACREVVRDHEDTQTSRARRQCTYRTQCGLNEHCMNGHCTGESDPCTSSAWCSAGERCEKGVCQ